MLDIVLNKPQPAQVHFDATYVSSAEICQRLGVTRPTIMRARRSGLLPDPIAVDGGSVYVWERATVEPFLAAWELLLTAKRNAA